MRTRGALRVQARIPFEVVRPPKAAGGYELRLYKPRFCVETQYTNRQNAYEAFDQYLTGKNEGEFGLDAPPPVVMLHDTQRGTKTMQMLALKLGSRIDDATLLQQPPQPRDARLGLSIAGGEVVAVLQFPGQATQQASEAACASLRQQLNADGTGLADAEAGGLYRVVQYSPVHSLQAKTNELWLAVQL